MSLLDLPIEVLFIIIESPTLTTSDHLRLRQTSWHLRNVVTPLLIRGRQDRALVFAAQRGYLHLAQDALALGGSSEAVDWRYRCPVLHWAAMGGHAPMVKLLLDNGAKVTRNTSGGWTALHWAAATGKAFVRGLVKAKFTFDGSRKVRKRTTIRTTSMSNEDAISAIILRAQDNAEVGQQDKSHEDVVALLLAYRARIDAKSKDKKTALCLAVQFGHETTVEFLLRKGADARLGSMIWLPSLAAGTVQDSVFRLLLGFQGQTRKCSIMYRELEITFLKAAADGNKAAIRALLDRGIPITVTKHENGQNALHLAAVHNHIDIITTLLDAGLDIDSVDQSGSTALHLTRCPNIMKLLLDKGADLEARDQYDRTPLHRAVISSTCEVVKVLLKNVAFIGAQDNNGLTPLHLAAMTRRADVTRLLVREGADVIVRGRCARTLLHDLVHHSNVDMVGSYDEPEVWTKRYMSFKGTYKDPYTYPLGSSVSPRVGWREMVELLVGLGVDIFAVDDMGMTAQMAAKKAGWPVMTIILGTITLRGCVRILPGQQPGTCPSR